MREEPWLRVTYYAPPESFSFDLAHEFIGLSLALDDWLVAQADFQPGTVESYDLWVCFGEVPDGQGVWPHVMEVALASAELCAGRTAAARRELLIPLVAASLTDFAGRSGVVLPPDMEKGFRAASRTLPDVPTDLRTPGRASMEATMRRARRKRG